VSAGFVIDSSVGFGWVRPSQATPETRTLLEKAANGMEVWVPSLWFVEMANGLLVLQRRNMLLAAERKAALQMLAALNLKVDDDPGRTAFGQASDLAEQYGLTVYDAIYLELALRLKRPLASRDAVLRKAANRCGVEVV
jgi:predicted nucleic acid-binding protein